MLPFLRQVLGVCSWQAVEIPVVTISHTCTSVYPKLRGGHNAFTTIQPRYDGRLSLDITIDYPGLGGQRRKVYDFPDQYTIEKIAPTKSQGWSTRWWLPRYLPSKIAGALGLWSHHDHAEWPEDLGKSEARERFIDHRCVDLLGALGGIMNGCWLSADVVSVCSGHVADIEVCRQAYDCMKEIKVDQARYT